MPCRAHAFTLFEVMLSMLIMAIAVLSVAALLPSGLQSQQAARLKTLAAVTAVNLIHQAETMNPSLYRVKVESNWPWGATNITHDPGRWDVERILSSSLHGRSTLVPVPLEIARRLDSDQDEIQQVLDRGGYLYFPSPLPSRLADFEGSTRNTGAVISAINDALPYAFEGFDEAQRLVIGFVGYAQQNALMSHPMTAAPYREWYPSPPIDVAVAPDMLEGLPSPHLPAPMDKIGNLDLAAWSYWNRIATDADTATDIAFDPSLYADFLQVFRTYSDHADTLGQLASDVRDPANDPTNVHKFSEQERELPPHGGAHHEMASRVRDDWYKDRSVAAVEDSGLRFLGPKIHAHYEACLTLATNALGVDPLTIDPQTIDLMAADPSVVRRTYEPWEVSALRFLGAAAMWQTRPDYIHWATVLDLQTDPDATDPHRNGSDDIPDPDLEQLTRLHELSLRVASWYAVHRPWDWGAPRMHNVATMMDNPLIQLDLFSSLGNAYQRGSGPYDQVIDPRTGSGMGYEEYGPSYRLLAMQGCSAPSIGNASSVAGNQATYRPPGVRTVDIPTSTYGNWNTSSENGHIIADRLNSYWGDPSHYNLHDVFAASHRCRQIVVWAVDWQRYEDAESAPAAPSDASWWPWDAIGNSDLERRYRQRGYQTLGWMAGYSNFLNWRVDVLNYSGTIEPEQVYGMWRYKRGVGASRRDAAEQTAETGDDASMRPWIGLYGLDANGNGRFDRGTVPPSVRMRATTVARFNFYDQRVFAGLRD